MTTRDEDEEKGSEKDGQKRGPEGQRPTSIGSFMSQDATLKGASGAAQVEIGARLLKTTGPVAEMQAAACRGALDIARRTLIAKKGAGVVFEANTLVRLQEVGERFHMDLRAWLPATAKNPGIDIFVELSGTEFALQLKAGSDRYIRAALKTRSDGVILLVPRDAATGDAVGELVLNQVTLEAPTRKELVDQSKATLSRLEHGEQVVSFGDMATRALRDSWSAGLVAVVIDLSIQALSDEEINWRRAGTAFLKAMTTTAAASFIAQASTAPAIHVAGHVMDATAALRGARVAGVIVPHAIDIACDWARLRGGSLSMEDFERSIAGHAGAATAEYLLFPVIAGLAAPLGPIGGALVIVGAGLMVSRAGQAVGEFLYDVVRELPADSLVRGFVAAADLVQKIVEVSADRSSECERRAALAASRVCEETACGREHHARGMCGMHYLRWWRAERRLLMIRT